ncbi:MAG: competence/damage-inducible protein A [Marinilabiliaceae bacterium]|nr:competence/damage-inducible protein A [Marinilabiliaceae bacterium]
MNLEIITIGNELLIGQVVDTNSAWMGVELNKRGFDVSRVTSVQDTADAIISSLKEALDRVDIILMTGGLGPTNDDITKKTLAEFFGVGLVFNEQAYADLCELLKGRVSHINDQNRGQAYVPENCEVIRNPVGTAPVMWFEQNGKIIVSMPGVPSEMKQAMEYEIMPRLTNRFPTGHIIHKTVLVYNIPEAVLAEQLTGWESCLPSFISLAYLPAPGRIRLRLSARSQDEQTAQAAIEKAVKELYPIIGDHIFSEEDKSAQELLGDQLRGSGLTVAVAESCTGGRIGHLITSIAGSSEYFVGGVMAYANEVKHELLKVTNDDLMNHGAVSQQVVEQMALGVKALLGTDYSVATSGIAGPGGATEEKPVGTVWIAVAGPDGVKSELFCFGGYRERNIHRSADMALILLIRLIEGKY